VTNRRGDGVGLELLTDRLVGVRLVADLAGRVSAAAEASCDIDLDVSVAAAMVRVLSALDVADGSVPVRIATFGTTDTMRAVDVTTLDESSRRAVRAAGHVATAYATDQLNARTWMLFTDVAPTVVNRALRSATSAGCHDVSWEPSPAAGARVALGTTLIGRACAAQRWAAAVADGAVILAAGACTWPPTGDELRITSADSTLFVDRPSIEHGFDHAAIHDTMNEHCAAARPAQVAAVVAGEPYPVHDAQHALSFDRIAVALGAAVSAAGLVPFSPVWTVTAPTNEPDDDRPWAVEKVADQPRPASPSTRSRRSRRPTRD
jgi:hypothetical protein